MLLGDVLPEVMCVWLHKVCWIRTLEHNHCRCMERYPSPTPRSIFSGFTRRKHFCKVAAPIYYATQPCVVYGWSNQQYWSLYICVNQNVWENSHQTVVYLEW